MMSFHLKPDTKCRPGSDKRNEVGTAGVRHTLALQLPDVAERPAYDDVTGAAILADGRGVGRSKCEAVVADRQSVLVVWTEANGDVIVSLHGHWVTLSCTTHKHPTQHWGPIHRRS